MASNTHQHSTDKHPFTTALTSVAEAAATLLPLVAIIAGIGMMTKLPPASSSPMFGSLLSAQQFYEQNQLEWRPGIALMLSSTDCSRCDILRSEMSEAGIPFVEKNVRRDDGAARLWQVAQKATQEPELPVVVINAHVVTPRVRSIRMALQRFAQ